MKYLLILLLASCTTSRCLVHIEDNSKQVLALLDSIDRFPTTYQVSLQYPDTSIRGKYVPVAHRISGFKREGRNILLYNRVYDRKYAYVLNDHLMPDTFDIDTIKAEDVKSITILTDKAGVWISHWGSEYIIIIHTK